MDDTLWVEEGQGLQALEAHSGDLLLVHAGVGDDVRQRSAFQVLHHHPQLVSNQEAVVHLYDVWVMVVAHDHHLIARFKMSKSIHQNEETK